MNKSKSAPIRTFVVFSITALVLASCARTPVPMIGATDVPVGWEGPVQPDAVIWPNTDWWNNFGSNELTDLIDLVKENNFDYANNIRNLRAAQIQLQDAGFQLWPTPNVQISNGASTSVTQLQDGTDISGGSSGPFQLSATVSTGSILSKPINYDRALNDYESRLAQVADSALNTMGTAASTYFQLLFQRDQIRATEQTLANAERVLLIAQARVESGVAIPIDLLNQQINVENFRNQLTSQRQNEFQIRASLALLLGRGVQGFDVDAQTLDGIEVPTVQPGLPSELLVRRPDLVQAEVNLRNSAISVDLARLAFLPSISLSGGVNASSQALADIVSDPASASFNLSASIAQTILDNGGRKRNVQQARLSMETALSNYRRSIIAAFNDIEVQLLNVQLIRDQGLVTQRNLESAEEQFRLAELRYDQGVANFQTVLNAQDQLATTRNQVLSNRLSQLNAIIRLYQSLGGGWEAGEILIESPEYASVN